MKNLKFVLVGLFLGLGTIYLHSHLSDKQGLELTSFLLVLIGSVYFGFAVLSHHPKTKLIETVVAILFVLMGVFGLWVSPWLLVIGLFLHGVWDLIHHNKSLKLAKIPNWYIPFCAAYDWTMALYILYLIVF